MPLTGTPHPVSSSEEAIDGDARCQSLIQGSATLAYACLLLRRGKAPLARHVLESLERKGDSFRPALPYLRAWADMEEKDFARAKTTLLEAARRQPEDVLALSLLQACLVLELREAPAPSPAPAPLEAAPSKVADASELALFEGTLSDPLTRAFGLWNGEGHHCAGRPELKPLLEELRAALPAALAAPVAGLEGGEIREISFSFADQAVTSWHGSALHAILVTEPLPQALLAVVRAEKAFSKAAGSNAPSAQESA